MRSASDIMESRIRRSLLLAALFGFITNILIAALCVGVSVARTDAGYGMTAVGPHAVGFEHKEGFGKSTLSWIAIAQAGVGPGETRQPPRWSSVQNIDLVQRLARVHLQSSAAPARLDVAYGWPMRSFYGGITLLPNETLHDYAALPLITSTLPTGGVIADARTLPLTPILRGLIVNTALYAAAWWLVVFGRPVIRQERRLRRGACLVCGYNRAGLAPEAPCPECSAASVH